MKQFIIMLLAVTLMGCGKSKQKQMKTLEAKKVGTIELVIFKTKAEYSKAEIIEAAKAVNPIVEQFDGFIGRKLASNDEGIWTDIVYWTDLASAEKASQEVMKSETCKKFFGMIDEESMQFMHLNPEIDTEI